MNEKERIVRVGDTLWSEAEHNRITNRQQWSERLFELLDGEFPEEKLHGDHAGDVDDYLHNKYSFGFCDLCGCFINYDSDQWYDLGLCEPEEQEWLEKTLESWQKFYADTACDDITDVCDMCFADLTTKDGFLRMPLFDDSTVVDGGGKTHAGETMGEFIESCEGEVSASDDITKISIALMENGLRPLREADYKEVENAKN